MGGARARWLLAIWLIACDEGGGPPDPPPPSPFEIIEAGTGDPNAAPLWPMRVGAIWGESVVEGITRRDGLELMRFVQPPLPDPLNGLEMNPPVVSWYRRTPDGLAFHGSTRQGFFPAGLLLVPNEVRVGMIWESEIDGVRVRFEVLSRAIEPTPLFGDQPVWTIDQTVISSGAVIATWTWIEGFGPRGDAGILRVLLPAEDQPGIDVDATAARAPISTGSERGGATPGIAHVSAHHVGPRTTFLAFSAGILACGSADAAGRVEDSRLDLFDTPIALDRCPGYQAGGEYLLHGHAGLALPYSATEVYWGKSSPDGANSMVMIGDGAMQHRFASYYGPDGAPETLAQASYGTLRHTAPFTSPEGMFHEAARTPARWVTVDHASQYTYHPTSGPSHVLMHSLRPYETPAPLTLRSAAGLFLASSYGVDGIAPPELVFHKAGNVHYHLFEDGRELYVTAPDGLVHRVTPTAEGGLTLDRIAQVALPPEESVTAVLRLDAGPLVEGSPLVVYAGQNTYTCPAGAPCFRPHTAHVVEALAPVEDPPPPSTAVSAMPDGFDVFVCWPRALGPPSAASEWLLAGRAPAVVIEEPEGAGSCVLLVRDLSTPPSLGPGAFHVSGTIPGVGRVDLAMGLRGFSEPNLDSFVSVLELPGLDVSYDPHGYAPNGGFLSGAAIFGPSGVIVSQPEHLNAIAGGVAIPGVPDAAGAGLWLVYDDPVATYAALSAGPGAPRFELAPGHRHVQSARPGALLCVDAHPRMTCTRLRADGTTEDLGEVPYATLELADGTLCGPASFDFRCTDPDGTVHDLPIDTLPETNVWLPEGRGWYALYPSLGGLHYVDVDAGTATPLDARCPAGPTRDPEGRWWLILEDDGMGGCFGRRPDLAITVARLSPTGVEEVTDFPQPRDVYDEGHALAGVLVGTEVVLVMTTGSERSAAVGGVGTRVRDIYRLPRSAFP